MFTGRMLKAVVRPASLALDKTTEELQRSLAEVNAEINIMLHKNAREIKHQCHQISQQNESLEREARDLREEVAGLKNQLTSMSDNATEEASNKDAEALKHIHRMLGDVSRHGDPVICGQTLESTFPEAMGSTSFSPRRSRNYLQMTIDLLESIPAYRIWKDCPRTSFLMLAGSTQPAGRATQSSLSWLSPAAVHVANLLTRQKRRVAFHSCVPEIREEPSASRQIASSLIYQVLAWVPEGLRHNSFALESRLNADAWASKEKVKVLKVHFQAVQEVLERLPRGEEVTIILDRLDMYEGYKFQLLKALDGLAIECPIRLKIFITMNRLPSDADGHECRGLLNSVSKPQWFGNLDWDQCRRSH